MIQDNLDKFPELEEIGKWLETHENSFLSSIYRNANRYKLSDKQIEAAKNSWERIKSTKTIKMSANTIHTLMKVYDDFLPRTYYNNMNWVIEILMRINDRNGEATEKQYESLHRIFYKYRKSTLKKIFKK